MNVILELADTGDIDEILKLYRSVLDTPYCRWSQDYPNIDNISDDLERDALFCLKDKGEIVATISIDKDENVEELECWDRSLGPAVEFSRLCVRKDYQGQGIPAGLISYMEAYVKNKGINSVHFLVSKYNISAQKAYSSLGYTVKGECSMYHDEYFCYEKKLE